MTARLACLALLLASPAAADLDRSLATLARAFVESDAELLRDEVLADSRIYLAVPAVRDEAGHVGAHQAYYHFRDFFAAHPTDGFALGERRAEGGSAEVAARWTYRGDDGPSRIDLRLTLGVDGDVWRVRALRDATR